MEQNQNDTHQGKKAAILHSCRSAVVLSPCFSPCLRRC